MVSHRTTPDDPTSESSIPPPITTCAIRPSPPHHDKAEHSPITPTPTPFYDPKLVLIFSRARTPYVREVITMPDIVVDGQGPSWEKLMEILSVKVTGVTVFEDGKDMMLFDGYVLAQNQRQFNAGLTWLANKTTVDRNVVVWVYSATEAALTKLWPLDAEAA